MVTHAGEITAEGPLGPLRGSIAGENIGGPVALILPGSGPTDRNGNSTLGIAAAPYQLLAQDLEAHGIASVRVDKRGMFGSAQAVEDANAVTLSDYVDDVRAWIKAIKQHTDTDCVWLVGHSEGGLVALAAAAEREDDICGLVLLSTAGYQLGDVLRTQLRSNPANAPLLDAAEEVISALEAGRRVDGREIPQPLLPLFYPDVQGFLISIFALDPTDLVSEIEVPTLILQGDRDIQVTTADAERLQSARPGAELVVVPDANHVLKHVASDNLEENLPTYADPDLPLADGIVEAIAGFITSHSEKG